MVNKRLKKLTAMLLSIVMVFSMVTEAFPAVLAVEGGDSAPSTREDSKNLNFGDGDKTRRPGLYVDFLGDNHNYQASAAEGERDTILGGASPALDGLTAPGLINQSKVTNEKTDTNPKGTVNTWHGYQQNETYTSGGGTIYDGNTVFWVGVGISRMNLLELFREKNDGVYGLELGFYYDSTFIEPYTGAVANNDEDYLKVIQAANLTNYQNYQWEGYSIVDARTDLIPQTDPVTQEVIQGPDMDEIMGENLADGVENPWRMTYVSLEKTNVDTNRFSGLYDDTKAAEEDLDTKYLLLIPFKLKAYDPNWRQRVCLRLTRSAGLLSMGGGEGDTPYAAWERVTTRNPGCELKLMTNFQGDLNIFDGGRHLEDDYEATLLIRKAGGDNNSARLTIENDPSENPVFADTHGQVITGLYGGTGMRLDVYVDTGYSVTVKVYHTDKEDIHVTYKEILTGKDNDKLYTFVMPEHNVTVEVIFEVTSAAEFQLYLSEEEQDSVGTVVENSGIQGNGTVLTSTYVETDDTVTPPVTTTTITKVDKDSPRNNSRNLPAEKVHYQSEVKAEVKVHGDYEAVIRIYNVATDGNIAPMRNTTADPDVFPADGKVEAGNVIILPTGGTITFDGGMPESDVVVYVTYRPARKYTAILEVHHENILPNPSNVAQLATTVYTKTNVPQAAYSGVVYQDDNGTNDPDQDLTTEMADDDHRAVKDPFRVIDRVDISSAAGSGSLGGDGRIPMDWDGSENSLMTLMTKAVIPNDLSAVKPLDLRWSSGTTFSTRQPEDGLRKNALGERYTDQEMADFYARLLELQVLAKAVAPSLGVSSDPDKVNLLAGTVSGGAAYEYYDLSRDQVQAYILDHEAYENYQKAKEQYDKDQAQYLLDKAAYEKYLADKKAVEDAGGIYEGKEVREPVPPVEPTEVMPPDLLTKVAASNRVAANPWYDPTKVTDPPAVVNDYKLEIRGGRQVAVVLEAESTYTVAKSIRIKDNTRDPSGNLVPNLRPDIVLGDASGKLVPSASYQNEFLFDMPEYDCIIEVTYVERQARELNLKIVGDYTPDPVDNNVTVNGYGPNPGSITATAITSLTKDGDKGNVLEDSTVSVLVHKDVGYSVGASVEYIDSNGQAIRVPTVPNSTTDMNDGTLFTFTMPKGATTITVTYTDKRERQNAHLLFTHEGTTTDTRNGGYWHGTTLTDITALEGEALQADITVMPGFYIYAAEAYTLHGSYPLTLSGNGWNNGLGGGVTIDTTMPDEEYWVHVVFRPGPPAPEPGQILTLRVNDPDNQGTTIADNHAEVTTPIQLGPLGLAVGSGALSQSGYAIAGDLVKLNFQPAPGYFVESIEVQPAGLGTSVTRTSDTTAEFTMPAASAAVVVTFRRTGAVPRDPLFLHLDKTERDASGAVVTAPENNVISFTSPTIRETLPIYNVGYLPATVPDKATNGAARPGELVELNIDVAPGWYIHSLTVSGDQGRLGYALYQSFDRDDQTSAVVYDAAVHYSSTAVTKTVATFVMPDSDAYVTVNYRKGPESGNPEPDRSEHEVELVVEDPENITAPYADNKASAVVAGIGAPRTIAAVGKAQDAMRRVAPARAGEEVTIDYSAAAGYVLEIILVTPTGLHVPVNYLGGNKARFTMPDSAVTAIVRFKREPAIQYTANLVLHFPAGTVYTDYDKIGEGSFLIPPTNGVDYTKLYSQTAAPGDRLDFDLLAHDGYYIETVTVGPQELGVSAPYTGSFGRQQGYVIMPAANIQINVYFKKGWPDDVKPDPETVNYDLTLKVYDAAKSNSSANFVSIGGTTLTTPNSDPVKGGGSLTITPRQSYDEDRVVVELHPDEGCYAQSITVTDSRGKNVPWQYVPGGIAFEMTPAHVTVTVKYAKLPEPTEPDDPNNPYKSYEVKLHTGSTNGTTVTYGDVTAMGAVELTGPNWPSDTAQRAQTNGASFLVRTPPQGQTLTLEVTPNTGYHVMAAYAVKRSTREQILLPMTQVPNGGTATFAMPEDDADVYVVFADSSDSNTPGPDPTRGDLPGTLIVAGPTGSGSGVMHGMIEDPTAAAKVAVTTGTVAASGAGSLYAPQGTGLTVDLTVNPGYSIAAIRVTDGYGNKLPYAWTEPGGGVEPQRQFTLTMSPTGGVRVYVELEKTTPRPGPGDPDPDPEEQLTAQVVVNNGGHTGNKAVLRYGPKAAPTMSGILLTPVYAGDEIWVDLTVAPGYQVEYVKVVPAKYGIAPTLYDLPTRDQSTSFLMPGEDVVVYVKFIRDTRIRRNVTLVAKGDEDAPTNPVDKENKATIKSEITATQGPVYPVTLPNSATVQAAPPTATLPAEWVTVDYSWADGYYVESITVLDNAENLVPYTQNFNDPTTRKGQIVFPAVDADVTVTITWGTTLPKYEAVLHVIDLDDPDVNDDSWGQLTWLNPPTGDPDKHQTAQVGALPTPGGTEILMVPAGEKVRVDAHAQDKGTGTPTYIQAAFVLHRASGQMISFNFTPDDPADPTSAFTGDKNAEFIMHQGRNDVYIYYTKDPQKLTDYAAVLMLDSPASDTTSTATITRTPLRTDLGETAVPSDTVTANDTVKTHGYVTATDGDTITVSVTPAPGYSIESILMTPLGTASEQGGSVVITRTGNTYTFTMPAHNVAVRVKLKEGSDKEYKATLHYKLAEFQDDGSVVIKDVDITKDWAQASYTQGGSTVVWNEDDSFELVPEGTTVEVGASITGTDLVLAAYVLEENGDMVPLSKTLEGLTEQHVTAPDNTKLDDTTDFTMPAADVHIFVWFTNKKPTENWRTAVLTVTDSDPNDPTKNNSGKNSATMESSKNNKTPVEVWSTGVPGHQFMWVEEEEVVTVKTKSIAAGYSFVEATISHSDATATQLLNQTSTVNPYTFTYDVEGYNSAVVVRYEASPLTRNPLNVVLIDKDNPGNGTVTNAAHVAATSLPALDVKSVSSAGARQRIPDVLSGTSVTYNAAPNAGYTVMAQLKGSAGQILKTWAVGHTSDSFDMPNEEATLELIYFKGYIATLSVLYTGGTLPVTVPEGEMLEDLLSQKLTVTANGSDTMTVADGTELTAGLTALGANDRLVGALLITADGTRWLSPTAATSAGTDVDKRFTHTITGKNAEIRLIVGPKTDPDPNKWDYLATVSAVNLPVGTDAPEIHVTPTANAAEGPGWTVAVPNDTVTVTVDVPYGYRAVLTTADGVTLNPDTFDGTNTAVSDGTVSFAMPARNVHVTVTYVKTRFTATIQTAGSGSGMATLAANGGTPVTAVGTISDLMGGETLDYTAQPNGNSTLTRILMTTAGGVTQFLTSMDDGSGTNFVGNTVMPADDVIITVFFDDGNNRHHIAFVTVEGTDGNPLNVARDIQNTTDSTLGGGVLWAYGDETHGMLVTFSVAPGYTAKVTAEYADGTHTVVSVTQQGNTGNATATLTMPDADVKVTITYSKTPPEDRQLKLRLVGHDQVLENQAILYVGGFGSASNLSLNGAMAPDASDLWSGNALTVKAGDPLDLDAGRHAGALGNYIIERATIGLLDPSDPDGQTLLPGTEVDIPLNEYGTTATGLHYMPDADAVVTVYYRLPYQATLFVVDPEGVDYNDGAVPAGPADTTASPHDKVPDVTMSVDRSDITPNSTTKTHDPIGNLNGSETVTTQVDKKDVTSGGTMPDRGEIASVIASTRSGTVHLIEDTVESTVDTGIYKYRMADLPSRRADDVDVTVILRKKDDPNKLHTATVYKVGHDNKPGNTAAIDNPTTAGLPNGTIWTGAYKDDEPVVTVTTEPGYYAIVTAVQTGTAIPVPVLQWATQGTAADPIVTKFKMPDADVDVTVEYVKEPPKADMTLTLLHHDGEAENKGDLYKDAVAVPDPIGTPSLTPFLFANGFEAVDSSTTLPTITDPFSKTTTTPVDAGDYLTLISGHGPGHYIKSITFQAAGFAFDLLDPPAGFVPRVPVSGGEIIIEFAPGKQSGRPFDPEHSERYYGTSVRLDPVDTTQMGNYVTGDTTDGNPNPDLSVAPKLGQQGWLLAESPDPEKNTVVVTVPALYDEDMTLNDETALADAGVDPTPNSGLMEIPPVYQFYWWDGDNSVFVPFTGDDISILKGEPLSYADSPKGDYPKDTSGNTVAQHYGYRLTLQVVDGATSDQAKALAKYIADGGEIYVTATRPGYVTKTDPDDPDIPWVESEKTQIIIKQDNVLKPYDPDNVDDPDYEDHWIRAENRGDYLLVTVPMLNNKAGDNPTEVDGTKHRLQLYLQMDGTDRDSGIINVSDWLNIQNVREYDNFWNVNLEYDPDWRTDPNHDRTSYLYDAVYENEIYYPDPAGNQDLYHGARFAVEILTDEELEAKLTDPAELATAKTNVAILREIFDNDGTMGTNNYRMYITSDETEALNDPLPNFRKDDYADFEVPRYYALNGEIQSWAPTHIAELMLYRKDAAGSGYELEPWLMLRSGLSETMSSAGDYPPAIYNGHWSMEFAFKSSELASDKDVLTYQMVAEKTSHLTYTHTDIELDTALKDPALYDDIALKFTFASPVALFCGDIAPLFPGPDQKINDRDRDILAGFNYGLYEWNEGEDENSAEWENSTYNPDSCAYAADLNGDGIISERDMAILMSEFNWKRRTRDYNDPNGNAPSGLDFGGTGIILLAEEAELEAGEETPQDPETDGVIEEEQEPEEVPEIPGDGEEGPPQEPSEETENPDGAEGAEGEELPGTPEPPGETEEPTEPELPEEGEKPTEPEEPEIPQEPLEPTEPEEDAEPGEEGEEGEDSEPEQIVVPQEPERVENETPELEAGAFLPCPEKPEETGRLPGSEM